MMAVLGCSMEDTQEDRLKDIDFTVVGEEQQPEALRDIIAEKSAEPFQISYTLGTEMYIAIGYAIFQVLQCAFLIFHVFQ